MIKLLSALWLTLVLPAMAVAQVPENPIIRIELARYFYGAHSVVLTNHHAFKLVGADNSVVLDGAPDSTYKIDALPDGRLSVRETSDAAGDLSGSGQARIVSFGLRAVAEDGGSDMGFARDASSGWHWYEGSVSCVGLSAGTIRLVDALPLEDYLLGVLDPEIGANVPSAALQAQAVAARTYSVRNMGKLAVEGADLDDTTRCEGYVGDAGITPAIRAAVESTRGLILTYQGTPIDAVYSTDCGGVTAPGSADEPYLQPVTDTFCAVEPTWTCCLLKENLTGMLNASPLTSVTGLDSLAVTDYDASGRAATVLIIGKDGGVKKVTGAKLRQVLGYNLLRSTRFTIKVLATGEYQFTGQGFGHGMGMCQEGAVAMAKSSSDVTFEQILKHYYTGVDIQPLTASLLAPPAVAMSQR